MMTINEAMINQLPLRRIHAYSMNNIQRFGSRKILRSNVASPSWADFGIIESMHVCADGKQSLSDEMALYFPPLSAV